MSTPRTDALIESGHITRGDVARWVRQLETELSAEREKVAKLLNIINRASTKFCEEGPDGEIASEMFRILGEARNK